MAKQNKCSFCFVIATTNDERGRAPDMTNRTYVIGVGMTKFDKPGTKEGDYPDWAKEAGEKALADAGIAYEQVGQAYAGYCYGDSTYGQRCFYQLGMTGIPVVNVNNNCSTGSSGAVPGAPGGAVRRRRLRDRARLREDGEGLARRQVHGSHAGDGQAPRGDDRRPRRLGGRAARRRRCSATPAASTWSATARRPSTTRGSARRTTSTRSTTPTPSSRTSTRCRTSATPRRSSLR